MDILEKNISMNSLKYNPERGFIAYDNELKCVIIKCFC